LIRDLSHMRLVTLMLPPDLTYDAIPRDVTFLHLKELDTSNIPSIIGALLDILPLVNLLLFVVIIPTCPRGTNGAHASTVYVNAADHPLVR